MAFFTETVTECLKCGKEIKFFGQNKGVSILVKSMFLSVCPECTKLVLDLLNIKDKKIKKFIYGK